MFLTTTKPGGARSVRDALMAELQREEITARIKQARKEAGLSQPEMAEALNVIPRTYQNYEYGRVPWGLINDIARVTGRGSEWLLHGDAPDLMNTMRPDGPSVAQLDRIEAKLDAVLHALADQAGLDIAAMFQEEVTEPDDSAPPRPPSESTPERPAGRRGRAAPAGASK